MGGPQANRESIEDFAANKALGKRNPAASHGMQWYHSPVSTTAGQRLSRRCETAGYQVHEVLEKNSPTAFVGVGPFNSLLRGSVLWEVRKCSMLSQRGWMPKRGAVTRRSKGIGRLTPAAPRDR